MHEMWNVHHQKNGVMNIRCDFFFFFMLHLWAVCQKMPVRPSHSAEDKLNLSKNCNKKTKQWMLQHEDFRTIRQSSKSSIHFIILKVVRFGIYRYIILKGFLYFCKDLHCFEKLWFIHPYYFKKTQTSICLCLAIFAESRTTFFCTLLCIFFINLLQIHFFGLINWFLRAHYTWS